MAASVGNSDTAALDLKVRAGGENSEVLSLPEASAKESSLCSDIKEKGTSCGRPLGSYIDDSLVKVIDSGGTTTENVELSEKTGKAVSTAQVLDDDICQSRCMGGGDVPELDPNVSKDASRLETVISIDTSRIEHKSNTDSSKLEPQTNYDPPKHEPHISIDNPDGNHAPALLENSTVIDPYVLSSSISPSDKSPLERPEALSSPNRETNILNQDKTTELKLNDLGKHCIIVPKLTSESSLGGNLTEIKNESYDNELPEIKSSANEVTGLSSENICPIRSDNHVFESELHKLKVTHQEKSECPSDKNLDNGGVDFKTIAQDCGLIEMKTAPKEPTNLEPDTSVFHKGADSKVLQVETSDFESESASEVNSASIAAVKAHNSRLTELEPAEEKSEVISKNSLGEYVTGNQLKTQDNNLPEAKSVDENSASDLNYITDITKNESNPNNAKSHDTNSAPNTSVVITDISLDTHPSYNAQKHQKEASEENSTVSDLNNSTTVSNSVNAELEKEGNDERPVREMLVRRKYSESTDISSEKPVLETLTFGSNRITPQASHDEEPKTESDTDVCVCLLCDRSYPAGNKDILAHLVLMHKFVIADVSFIASLPAYLRYWKARFQEKSVSEFCSKIVTNTGAKDQAPKEEFYLLCDALPEDKSIREHLQRKKLESVLAQQQKEREETKFCRQCLFCKQTFCGNRAVLFDHLLRDHTFHMGQPDNLVYTDELFDLIQSKLDNQLCLFCEKSFKDKASLREHMRKKQHRKINPKNKEYDRFYIVNYMEMGKNWESLQSEDNRLIKSNEKDTDEEEEWSGWNEESESKVVCLFCDSACVIQTDLQQHMKDRHSFDLQEVNNKLQLNFYQKVKLINYIRRQVYHKTCYGCLQTFEDKDKLLAHFDEFSDHIKKIPDAEVWDQPQYFFPTYEDDCLLCHLDDDDEGAAGDALGVMVIAETIPVTDTILEDQKLCRDLLKS